MLLFLKKVATDFVWLILWCIYNEHSALTRMLCTGNTWSPCWEHKLGCASSWPAGCRWNACSAHMRDLSAVFASSGTSSLLEEQQARATVCFLGWERVQRYFHHTQQSRYHCPRTQMGLCSHPPSPAILSLLPVILWMRPGSLPKTNWCI